MIRLAALTLGLSAVLPATSRAEMLGGQPRIVEAVRTRLRGSTERQKRDEEERLRRALAKAQAGPSGDPPDES